MTTQTADPITDVKTFRAESMREAIQIVKDTMGPDAVILHTRQIPGKRLLPWHAVPDEVEITAGIGINVPSHRPGSRSNYSAQPRVRTAQPQELPAHLAQASQGGVTLELSQSPRRELAEPMNPRQLHRADQAGGSRVAELSLAELAKQIESIQHLLNQMGLKSETSAEPAARAAEERPGTLADLYQNLLERDVPAEIAKSLIDRLHADCNSADLGNPAATKAMLTGLIEQDVSTSGPIQVCKGERKVVALVGATGVGKTTTIAKLAANFRLRDQVKMGLVTVDTYRIAAVEQLRTYAEIIDLPMKVVTNPLEMRRALDDLAGLDLVLIDTAGRSPRDELQIQELKRLLMEARVDEVHLVLSLTSSLRSLLASVQKFATANASRLILTKLDEAAGLGNLLALSRDVSLPISYLTMGQDVPNDIEPARPERIARLILGNDELPK